MNKIFLEKTETVQVSFKSETPVAATEVTSSLEPVMGKKLLTTNLTPASFTPDVAESYTLAPAKDTSNEKRQEEERKRFANMMQVINGLRQFALNETVAEPTAEVKKQAFDMVGYMLAMMNAMIETMNNQAAIGEQSTQMSGSMTILAKEQLAKANADIAKLQQEEYDASHRSFWEKLWSAVKSVIDVVVLPFAVLGGLNGDNIGACYKAAFEQFCKDNQDSGGLFTTLTSIMMIVLSPFCGGTSLALMGCFMLLMQGTGGQEALDNWINQVSSNVGCQLGMQIAASLLEAICLAYAAGVIDSAVGAISKETLADAAALGANLARTIGVVGGDVSGISKLISSMREFISSIGTKKAAEEGIELAERGAAAAAEVEDVDASIAASNSSQSIFRTILENAAKKAFGESKKEVAASIVGKTLVQTGTNSFWSKILKAFGASDELSALLGAALGICVALAGMKLDAAKGSGDLANQLEKVFGEQAFEDVKMTLGAMTSIFALQNSSYLVLQGLKQFDIGETLLDLGTAQGIQALLSDLLDRFQTITRDNNGAMTSLAESYGDTMGNMERAFVQAWTAFI